MKNFTPSHSSSAENPDTTSAQQQPHNPNPANNSNSHSNPAKPPQSLTPPPAQPPLQKPNLSIAVAWANLQQQELKSYTTTFSPRCVISLYFLIGIIFLPLGVVIVVDSAKLRTYGPQKYKSTESDIGTTHNITFTPEYTIRKPSYFYYSLSNYFQNSRDYVKSRSALMNRGIRPKAKLDVENCERYLCPDGGMKCLRVENTTQLNIEGFIYPCGLTAWTFFNDSFKLCKGSSSNACANQVSVSTDNIAWWTDTKYKFNGNPDDELFTQPNTKDFNNGRSANDLLEDPHFVVWMRLSAFSTFYKLYYVINEDLKAGTNYTIVINNNYPVHQFRGEKFIFITETTWFGDANAFLGTLYLIVGFVSLVVAIFLLTKHVTSPIDPSNVDPAILLREHLAKFENSPVQPLHLN